MHNFNYDITIYVYLLIDSHAQVFTFDTIIMGIADYCFAIISIYQNFSQFYSVYYRLG
jgi:hypothetical protein